MDSRSYIFIYPLKQNADIPADFPREVRNLTFETGVFMPQDDSNWFTRPPKYPARLLLLQGRSLHIVSHPTSDELPTEIKLDNLLQLETGSVLLLGWIKLTTRSSIHDLVYNTRASRPLEEFLRQVRRRWLENVLAPTPTANTQNYGDDLDVKFNYSMRGELDRGETVVASYFQAPVPFQRKVLLFRRNSWRPGNLILLTSWNRIVWITDQYRGSRELYASISFSALSGLLQNCRTEEAEGQYTAVISFSSGLSWRIPVYVASEEIRSMCQVITSVAKSN